MSDTLRAITTTRYTDVPVEEPEQRYMPKPATTPTMWANNHTQQKKRR